MKLWLELFKSDPLSALTRLPLTAWLVLTALGGIALCFAIEPSSGQETQAAASVSKTSSLDTFIPQGYVLIPIELENYNSVDSILGTYGIVDLYSAGDGENRKTKPLARRIKILRAPQNPSQFAVLVPEQQAALFFRGQSVFFAAIQNPKETGTSFVNKPASPKSRQVLVFEQEDL